SDRRSSELLNQSVMDRHIPNGSAPPRPFTTPRTSIMDYPMHDANEKDELDPGKPLPLAASPSRKRKKLADGGTETEIIELQLKQTVCILKKYLPDYDPARAHYFAAQLGVSIPEGGPNIPTSQPPPGLPMMPYSPSHSGSDSFSLRSPIDNSQAMSPSTPPTPYFRPPYAFPTPPHVAPDKPMIHHPSREENGHVKRDLDADNGKKGLDPRGRNMANPTAIARGFGVNSRLLDGYSEPEPMKVEGDDLPPVSNSSALHPHLWQSRPFRRNQTSAPSPPSQSTSALDPVWLPKNREIALNMIEKYFKRLNFHRPIFEKDNFLRRFEALYNTDSGPNDDSGFLCSTYMILALATLSEMHQPDLDKAWKERLQKEWPTHEILFSRALVAKSELRVTISSLQALLLLQCRSLWRLVGTLVRLAVELGLHHDPMMQKDTFTPEELAIGEEYFNTSYPIEVTGMVSRHFVDSAPLNSVAADIIRSLYRPDIQSTEEVIHHSRRILINMTNWRKTLPSDYHPLFLGTVRWNEEDKKKFRKEMTTEKGLTFLKYSIQRLLLLRAVFTNDEMTYDFKIKALEDAAITIIYGQSCGFTTLSYETGYEDVQSALHITPALRWTWERKDASGGVHPITLELANRVFKRKPSMSDRPKQLSDFLPEVDWNDDKINLAPIPENQLNHWPSGLFLPGPVSPERHQLSNTRTDGSNSSQSASPNGQHAIPAQMPMAANGSAIAGPSMPGNGTSYFKTEELDFSSLFAQVPGYAINFQPELEHPQLFMEEEKDRAARPHANSKRELNQKMMEQLQHM
ncbi:3058_t:CDS:2, partial [Acaulospora colombiana]